MYWLLLLLGIPVIFYYILIKPQLYWKHKNVKQGPPIPFFGDNLKIMLFQESALDMLNHVYYRFKNARYCGMYLSMKPALMLRDPELIKQITVKDFDHFVDHREITSKEIDPLWGNSVFGLNGENWRDMRTKLSPAFTASKMRAMFVLMEECALRYVDFYKQKNENFIEVDLRDSFSRFSNDVIANCAFGIEVDSFNQPDNEFYKYGRDVTNLGSFKMNLIFWLNTISKKISKVLDLHLFDTKSTNFFKNLVLDTIKVRDNSKLIRPDVIHLLMEARKGRLKYEESAEGCDTGFATVKSYFGKEDQNRKNTFTETEVAAQLFIFYFAGFETTSSMMSMLCFELAIQPEIQMKLYQEIQEIYRNNNGKLTFELLNKMKYLDMVITESLRKYPPVTTVDRICTKEYILQTEHPDEYPVHLKPGDLINIPIIALQYDEQYYPNPHKFIPERFSDENKHNIKPYTYLPFGSGPRNCIGSRFGLMEAKTLVFHLIRNFELIVIDKTNLPIKFAKGRINLYLEGGTWVGFKQREN